MVENPSNELPVARWVYYTENNGRFDLRAANFPRQILLYNPFFATSVRELGSSSYDGIRSRLVTIADINHLDGIAFLLQKQHELFPMFRDEFARYAAEKKLPKELVRGLFINPAARYREWTFAEQLGRLNQLEKATGNQLDLLEALKNPDDAGFIQLAAAYQRIHDVVRSFAGDAAQVSQLYDASVQNLYGYAVPADLVKFGGEPEVILPETKLSEIDSLELALQRVAHDPLFVAEVHRRASEARSDITRLVKAVALHKAATTP